MRAAFSIGAVVVLAVLAALLLPDGLGWRGGVGGLVIVAASVEMLRVVMLWSRSDRRVAHLVLAVGALVAGVALAASWPVYVIAAFIVAALLVRRQLFVSEADG